MHAEQSSRTLDILLALLAEARSDELVATRERLPITNRAGPLAIRTARNALETSSGVGLLVGRTAKRTRTGIVSAVLLGVAFDVAAVGAIPLGRSAKAIRLLEEPRARPFRTSSAAIATAVAVVAAVKEAVWAFFAVQVFVADARTRLEPAAVVRVSENTRTVAALSVVGFALVAGLLTKLVNLTGPECANRKLPGTVRVAAARVTTVEEATGTSFAVQTAKAKLATTVGIAADEATIGASLGVSVASYTFLLVAIRTSALSPTEPIRATRAPVSVALAAIATVVVATRATITVQLWARLKGAAFLWVAANRRATWARFHFLRTEHWSFQTKWSAIPTARLFCAGCQSIFTHAAVASVVVSMWALFAVQVGLGRIVATLLAAIEVTLVLPADTSPFLCGRACVDGKHLARVSEIVRVRFVGDVAHEKVRALRPNANTA